MYNKVFFGLITGFVVILYTIFMVRFPDRKIAREGKVVQMEIVELSAKPWTTKSKGRATLRYMEQDFTIKVGRSFYDNYQVGNMIEMRYLEGETHVLFPKDTGMVNFIAFILIGVFILYCLIYTWVKMLRPV